MIIKKIDELKQNPNNPKKIDYFKLEQLKKSIKDFPEMLEIRPIVIDAEGVIIGGNMRWKAAKELGIKEVPVLILEDKEREWEFLIKDNLSYGEWNWEGLSHDFKSSELLDWGLDVPLFYREDDIEMGVEAADLPILNGEQKEAPKSTKKALYLFYTAEEKENLQKKIKEERGEFSVEDYILQKIRLKLDGSFKS
jgi:hypothetical protein